MGNDYIRSAEVGFGKCRKNQGGRCVGLNHALEFAVECFDVDRVFFYARLLKEGNCKISRVSSRKFLNRFRDD